MTTEAKKIGFIGLGAMGARMAKRLLDAGYDLVVYNRSPEAANDLVAQGARRADTPRDAAEGRDVVISMVRDDAASREVWLDSERGALAGMDRGALAVESSTVTPSHVEALARAASDAGFGFVDAPVAGSRPQAEGGQLAYLVGADSDALARVEAVLRVMGGAVHHVGPAGAGAAMKLAVNAWFGVQVVALAEVLGLLERHGVPLPAGVETLTALPIASPALKGVGALMAAGKFDPMFPVDLVEKDFGYVVDAASSTRASVPMAEAARAVFAAAKAEGLGGENIHAVVKRFEAPRGTSSR